MTNSTNQVEKLCPELSTLGNSNDRPAELLDKLKEEMEKALTEDQNFKTALEEMKSTPSELQKAYMVIPKIVDYYEEVRDGIDGAMFSEFGSLHAIKNLHEELSRCTEDLGEGVKGHIKDLLKEYKSKYKTLETERNQKIDNYFKMLSCVDIEKKDLERKKNKFCDLAGVSYKYRGKDKAGKDAVIEEKLSFCEKQESESGAGQTTVPPPGAAARISWWGSRIVEMFKQLGVTDEQGKKSIISCNSLSATENVIYAYLSEIKETIEQVEKAEGKSAIDFKKELDDAWKDWINATHRFFEQHNKEKNKRKEMEKAKDNFTKFRENYVSKFIRDAQDAQAGGSGTC